MALSQVTYCRRIAGPRHYGGAYYEQESTTASQAHSLCSRGWSADYLSCRETIRSPCLQIRFQACDTDEGFAEKREEYKETPEITTGLCRILKCGFWNRINQEDGRRPVCSLLRMFGFVNSPLVLAYLFSYGDFLWTDLRTAPMSLAAPCTILMIEQCNPFF